MLRLVMMVGASKRTYLSSAIYNPRSLIIQIAWLRFVYALALCESIDKDDLGENILFWVAL